MSILKLLLDKYLVKEKYPKVIWALNSTFALKSILFEEIGEMQNLCPKPFNIRWLWKFSTAINSMSSSIFK